MSFAFFVSTGLQMEEALSEEIREVWPWLLELDGRAHAEPVPELRIEKGGVEFEAPLHLGLQLNFLLKSAHRILLRMGRFQAKDFPKLFHQAHKIKWREWLKHDEVFLEIAASGSRLNNEKRIAEALQDSWKLKRVEKDQAREKIYVRVLDDQFVISLDTSGEHLHFRGRKKWNSEAPLRETLAAFCLQRMISRSSWSHLHNVNLVDPMMGSGTFLLEALTMSEPSPRRFAFQDWKKCPKALTLDDFQRPWQRKKHLWRSLSGFDLDAEAIKISQKNLQDLSRPLRLEQQDVFAKPKDLPAKPWLILNPPYGERLEWKHTPSELLSSLQKNWQPQKLGILWSQRQADRAPQQVGDLRLHSSYPLQNGGLSVRFQIWEPS